MSYEGYVEKLCEKGHLSSFDVYEGEAETCPRCGTPWAFTHSVDQTNGIEEDDDGVPYPNTIGYPFEENGFENEWHVDHYGTRYATKIFLYKLPEGPDETIDEGSQTPASV